MLISFGNWELAKSNYNQESSDRVYVRMVANSLKKDKENDVIMPQAFNQETVDYFLKNGIIDWNHTSVIGETIEERARAILGKPEKFEWVDSKPVVYGYLTKTHPIVRESILPHLEADQKVFGASIGGFIKKSKVIYDKETNENKRLIYSIEWNHIAIAPLPFTISSETYVELVKSKTYNNDVLVKYPDILSFVYDFSSNELKNLKKAIEMGYETDISNMVQGDALRVQSLNPDINNDLSNLIELISNGLLEPKAEKIIEYLKSIGYNDKKIIEIINKLVNYLKKLKENLKTITDRSLL